MVNELSKDDMLRICDALVGLGCGTYYHGTGGMAMVDACHVCRKKALGTSSLVEHDNDCPVLLADRYIEEYQNGE